MRRSSLLLIVLAVLSGLLAGCDASADSDVQVVVGYQSKTIDTVTAGTLLRATGFFEQRLQQLGQRTGKHYTVVWQDYPTGAPITAQMLAGKIDIGSMGDYPLLINGSRAQKLGADGTKMVAVTGYDARGALNMVLASPGSPARTLADLKGKQISTSVGSAAHGTLVNALQRAGLNPGTDVHILNQDPSVGATALESGQAEALSQFVAWPGQLVFEGKAKPLYDGAELNVPTLHGTVARDKVIQDEPDVLQAFLKAQLDATNYLHANPLRAAQQVADATGLPPEVVYLYNGAGGMVTFDATIKPLERTAMAGDVPFLKSIGNLQDLDVKQFIDDGPLRAAYGDHYAADVANTANPSPISGTDSACGTQVNNPATASELWLSTEDQTHPAATPTCLLRQVKQAEQAGKKVRAAYVPDALTGTRWFADKSIWLLDPTAPPESRVLPFVTPDSAQKYRSTHPSAAEVSYSDAIGAA
jgi:NitT/TauT family transport system substrate-binding protein